MVCCLLCALPVARAQQTPAASAALSQPDNPYKRALDPFWRTGALRESVLFIASNPGATLLDVFGGVSRSGPQAKLLFLPDTIVNVTSMSRDITYQAGRDYVVDKATGTLYLPPASRIPYKTLDQLHPVKGSKEPTFNYYSGDPNRALLVSLPEFYFYHSLQVEVTYTFAPGQWKGYVPQYAGAILPRTTAKLKAASAVKILLMGDSISYGYNSTKLVGTQPFTPNYGELVAGALRLNYRSAITFKNHAVDGSRSSAGLTLAANLHLGADTPDLVIVAYGMNDVTARSASAFQQNVQGIIDTIRKEAPNVEFLLVSSMLPNPETSLVPNDQFVPYRDALAALAGPGVAFADETAVWQEVLKRKSFLDITGNAVNHPNDFGHELYAQTILGLLVGGPYADAGSMFQVAFTPTYTLDASTSLAGPNGGPLTYLWAVPTTSNPETITGADTATPTVTFLAGPGTYRLTLTVTDSKGVQDTRTIMITYVGGR
jgi:acyl-CoA thioesterase I